MQKIGHFAQVRLCITDYMCMIIINGILYCVSLILHKLTLFMQHLKMQRVVHIAQVNHYWSKVLYN